MAQAGGTLVHSVASVDACEFDSGAHSQWGCELPGFLADVVVQHEELVDAVPRDSHRDNGS